MNVPDWREHIVRKSLTGGHEEERPIFIGPEPSMEARREYMAAYLDWATGCGGREWLEAERTGAERLTANAWADDGVESMGNDLWELVVDNTLWNMAFDEAGYSEYPEFPWKDPSDTAGGESETYMHLKTLRRAEVEADEFLDRLAQREAGAQSGKGPEAQG